MKKSNLFFVLLTAIIVMSCSKDETTMSIPQDSNAIAFGTYVGRDAQTRGAEMNIAKLSTDHFGVLAYYTGQNEWTAATTAYPNFMYNQEIIGASTGDGGVESPYAYTWSYSPIKYWPTTQNDKVSFFAYAPYVENPVESEEDNKDNKDNKGIVLSKNTDTGNPTIKFTVQDEPKDMVDLVTASVMDVVGADSPSPVNFKFQHALSRVNFIAKASELLNNGTDANKTIINITDVKLDGITGGQFYKSGKYTLSSTDAKGVWSDQTAFTTSEGYDIAGILANTTPVVHGEYSVDGVKLEGVSPVNLFTGSQYLFLIPPANALTANGATVTFTYDIVTIDDNLSPKYSKTTATKTVALPEGTLQQGVAYNYTFTFNVDQVVVTASVADWGTIVEKEVEVDYTDDI